MDAQRKFKRKNKKYEKIKHVNSNIKKNTCEADFFVLFYKCKAH